MRLTCLSANTPGLSALSIHVGKSMHAANSACATDVSAASRLARSRRASSYMRCMALSACRQHRTLPTSKPRKQAMPRRMPGEARGPVSAFEPPRRALAAAAYLDCAIAIDGPARGSVEAAPFPLSRWSRSTLDFSSSTSSPNRSFSICISTWHVLNVATSAWYAVTSLKSCRT
jgi:hypothetical protein